MGYHLFERKITLSKVLNAFLQENLKELRDQGLYNEIDPVEGPNGPIIKIKGKDLINLSSNNYLGTCNRRRFEKAGDCRN